MEIKKLSVNIVTVCSICSVLIACTFWITSRFESTAYEVQSVRKDISYIILALNKITKKLERSAENDKEFWARGTALESGHKGVIMRVNSLEKRVFRLESKRGALSIQKEKYVNKKLSFGEVKGWQKRRKQAL